ncbi:hypothetical protein EDD37DRAFT_614548 [Exophiala viscosa]|uniref:MINDY deubiquitinase domain-containing protein n=1 Tax=Exophiala viscosa TaxID=2486360 RepID=A0AAN6DKD6_9EURO|nr:hypothetical protein EDD36DRAFT_111181 [Exophiala viscosa]KAI1628491.1 hypothetical protein EDD37DRAFT_614548 [Exophiala viscosa]
MVSRKTSLPYPASSSSQADTPPHNTGFHSNLIPDSADLPPVTRSPRTSPRSAQGSFQNTDNPWSDVGTQDLRSDRPLPEILRAGPRPHENNDPPLTQNNLSNVPQALRVGQPREDTPRSSLDSDRSKGFWEESDDEGEERSESPKKSLVPPEVDAHSDAWVNVEPLEKSQGIKRKPVAIGMSPQPDQPPPAPPFASNNPFRRPSQQVQAAEDLHGPDWSQDAVRLDKGKAPVREDAGPPTDYFRGVSLGSSTVPDLSSYNGQEGPEAPAEKWQNEKLTVQPPMPQAPPPPPPAEPFSPFSKQPGLIPVSPQPASIENPWSSNVSLAAPTPSPIPFSPSQKNVSEYNDGLLDRGQRTGVVSLKDELETLPNAAENPVRPQDEPSLLEDDVGPPLPVRPSQQSGTDYFQPPAGPPPSKAPRPTIRTTVPSEEEVARMVEQRNETYQIKHFNWFDHSSRKLRRSSMLTQNKNGPCPLLALVNALILGAQNESQAVLDEALRSREQVTLGLIIETLMDELLSRGYEAVGGDLPDVDELNSFLMRLRTGMNANPRFVPYSATPPNLMDDDDSMLDGSQRQKAPQRLGTFEATTDMKLYGAFSVSLIHGWLPDPSTDTSKAFARSAPTYEDAQALQFGEEELEYKMSRQGLTPAEQNMWDDIMAIKDFFKTYPTQLTPTGLEVVQETIAPGTFAIMFRNDHFSTVYKHPESGQLFTLITDAGYADRDEIIWESLLDISGKHNEFFSGDFMPVSHHDGADDSSTHPASRRTSQLLTVNNPDVATPLSPQEQQEQHDADFAMALQLQEEEEQRQRAERNRRRSSANTPSDNNNNRNSNPRRSTGNIPITLSRPQPEVRPAIPPRNSHAPASVAVSRPVDPADEAPPPLYEEAVKGQPYIPPLGSPLHPSAEPSPMNSNTQLTGTVSNTSTSAIESTNSHQSGPPPGAGPGVLRRQPGRRASAYSETSQYYSPHQQRIPGGYSYAAAQAQGFGGPSRQTNMQRMQQQQLLQQQQQDRDCVVM